MTETNETLSIQEPEKSLPSFSLADLPVSLKEACARAGWESLMPVQSLALPYLLKRRDLMIQSHTGSGKTGCYLLPLLATLPPEPGVRALVLVPTRELAVQVEKEAEIICAAAGIIPVAVYGGVGYKKQTEALAKGASLVVGTPGRILDHILRRTLDLSGITELVLDEADRMLSIGFYPDMKEIRSYLPHDGLHTTLLSATYPPHVLSLAQEFMRTPDMLSLSHGEVHVAEVHHCFCQVGRMDKDRALIRLLESENPSSAIVFCNTKANVAYLTEVLKGFGYNAEGLSSDLSQSKREEVLQKILNGSLTYLVATDVASRGIDIPALSHVFLYEPPEDHESYIHRAGRTGRCGCAGTVISLTDIMEKLELERIARYYHIALQEIQVPDDEAVAKIVGERLITLLEARYRSLTGLERIRIDRYLSLAKELASESDEQMGLRLLAMLLDACHHETLTHSLFPVPQASQKSTGKSRRRSRRRRHPGQGQDEKKTSAE